jgi:hypothetical protein
VAGHRGAQRGEARGTDALEIGVWHGQRGISDIEAAYDTPQLWAMVQAHIALRHQNALRNIKGQLSSR